MTESDLKDLLDSEARRINRPTFILNDPVQFPRRFTRQEDIEITAFLAATIAWGNRKMICRNAEKMLSLMDHEPYLYTMEEGYNDLDPKMNIHRTFFAEHLQQYLRGLREIYRKHGTLDNFCRTTVDKDDPSPAWSLVEKMLQEFRKANDGEVSPRCLPMNLKQTALKRVNMALRWLVRDDGIVDMGIWKSIPKSKLYIPLDVHVGETARELGLLNRKSNDRKAVEELTGKLQKMWPEDPAWYDFALFGIGIGE